MLGRGWEKGDEKERGREKKEGERGMVKMRWWKRGW